ncbi:AT hook motif protein [Crocosphaera sp.]|uniref:AT hook motif protein n=1 Tax=Crocosphaera sp. TaxID=2729996 RepID=UPI003F221D87|nr:AT hook motif protein [Crocosphaera sp.]
MQKEPEFPFEKARRITQAEVIAAQKAIKEQFNLEKPQQETFSPPENAPDQIINIPVSSKVIEWAKKEAQTRGTDYKTVINEELLKIAETTR